MTPLNVSSTVSTLHGMQISWTTIFVALLNVLVGGVLVGMVKNWPAVKKITADREANLLSERADDMKKMHFRIEKLEAERTADHHTIANVSQCLSALFMLLRAAPDDVAKHVDTVEKMRAQQLKGENVERAAIMNMRVEHVNEITDAEIPK